MLRGIDVSSNNPHPIDWVAVKNAGASFAFVKATEGVGYKDAPFDADWSAVPRAGLARGCYAFARPEWNEPLQEAAWFIHKLPPLQDYDIIALDVETGGSPALSAWALAWLQDVEHALGVTPLIYCDQDYALNWLTDPQLAHYPLWLAAYEGKCPASIGVWPYVTLWQHSSTSTYQGIQGPVDESLIARDLPDFLKLGKQPKPAPPPPPPTAQKWKVLVDMRLRPSPDPNTSFWPPQYCYRNAVLDGTGQASGPWLQVVAGGRAGWLLRANLQAVP